MSLVIGAVVCQGISSHVPMEASESIITALHSSAWSRDDDTAAAPSLLQSPLSLDSCSELSSIGVVTSGISCGGKGLRDPNGLRKKHSGQENFMLYLRGAMVVE